jgi:hypothetical protein
MQQILDNGDNADNGDIVLSDTFGFTPLKNGICVGVLSES